MYNLGIKEVAEPQEAMGIKQTQSLSQEIVGK